jgi:hypothetical protein
MVEIAQPKGPFRLAKYDARFVMAEGQMVAEAAFLDSFKEHEQNEKPSAEVTAWQQARWEAERIMARRIVACLNFCESLSTELIEELTQRADDAATELALEKMLPQVETVDPVSIGPSIPVTADCDQCGEPVPVHDHAPEPEECAACLKFEEEGGEPCDAHYDGPDMDNYSGPRGKDEFYAEEKRIRDAQRLK